MQYIFQGQSQQYIFHGQFLQYIFQGQSQQYIFLGKLLQYIFLGQPLHYLFQGQLLQLPPPTTEHLNVYPSSHVGSSGLVNFTVVSWLVWLIE